MQEVYFLEKTEGGGVSSVLQCGEILHVYRKFSFEVLYLLYCDMMKIYSTFFCIV